MIRLENHTPSVYTKESRDFQLFLRLYDAVINGVKFDIDTIPSLLDPFMANNRIVELLCSRVGFFPKATYDTQILRYIISAFSYIIKHKGCKEGIYAAVYTILKAETNKGNAIVLIDTNNHNISIQTDTELYNKKALEDVLSYIIPIGFTSDIERYQSYDDAASIINTKDSGVILVGPINSLGQIRGTDRVLNNSTINNITSTSDYNFDTETKNQLINNYTTTEIVGSANYMDGDLSSGRSTTDKASEIKESNFPVEGSDNNG